MNFTARHYNNSRSRVAFILFVSALIVLMTSVPTAAQQKASENRALYNSERVTTIRRGNMIDVARSSLFTDFTDNVRVTSNIPELQLSDTQNNGRLWRLMSGSSAPGSFNIYDNNANNNAGAFRLTIDTSGNVGIGTTSPAELFHVAKNNAAFLLTRASGDYGLRIKQDNSGGNILYQTKLGDNATWQTYIQVGEGNSSGSSHLILQPTAGNVGIGTTSPGYKLDVAGDISTTGSARVRVSSADAVFLWANSSNAGLLNGAGNFGLIMGGSPGGNNTSMAMYTSGSARMFIDSSGNVGIGGASSGNKLEVNGTISGTNVIAKYQDVAEWVPSSEQLSTGTVVVLDSTKSNQVTSSSVSYDTRVAGVVSEQPGIALGEKSEGKVLVATTGRVRVKVDASKGPIHIGDLLVTSDIPGVAMKSEPVNLGGVQFHRPGTLIGKALEPLEKGKGQILVLLSLQ